MVKKILIKLFAQLGYMVTKLPTIENQIKSNKYKWLQNVGIKTVLDVGANDGQFATEINKILAGVGIYSFEPLHDVFNRLVENTRSIANIKCFNFAIGDDDTNSTINRSEFSQSSSILKMGELHKEAYPFTAKTYEEKIVVKKLDSVRDNMVIARPLLLKMDVQGYEMNVLKGAAQLLNEVDIIFAETSFFELYHDQALFKEIYEYLDEKGFKYIGNLDQFTDPYNGKILQADSIFIRTSLKI